MNHLITINLLYRKIRARRTGYRIRDKHLITVGFIAIL